MVELVDTQDLKSCSRKRSAGSIPALSTKPDTCLYRAFCFCTLGYPLVLSTNLKLITFASHNYNINIGIRFKLFSKL
jgi:hypothetical protein